MSDYQEHGDALSAQQIALKAVLADWSPTTDFASEVARILHDGQIKGPLHRAGLPAIDEPDDFWSSIGGTATPENIGDL